MKKKAFTLTELLVVVVIIGTLAAVVLPKFTKMVETRKLTEAEDVMGAIRTEQEARCTLGKSYLTNGQLVASNPKSGSQNYTYTFTSTGVTATSKNEDKSYELKMPSYADGRICCSGTYCQYLNRDYVSCDTIQPETSPCESTLADDEGPLCDVPSQTTETHSCGCTNKGTKSRSFDAGACSWGDWSACTEKETDCVTCQVPSPTTLTESCGCTNSGTRTNTFNVDSCGWSGWSACTEKETDCGGGCEVPSQTTETQNCGCTNSGIKTRGFNIAACSWSDWSACTEKETNCCQVPSQTSQTQNCGCTNSGTKSRSFDESSCSWGDWSACTEKETDCGGGCDKPATKTEECDPADGVGTIYYMLNNATCKYEYDYDTCTKEERKECSSEHREGEVTHFPCVCGEGERTWHCGEDTGHAWNATETKSCESKPSDQTYPCPAGTCGSGGTVKWTCLGGKWAPQETKSCESKPADQQSSCPPDTCGTGGTTTWACQNGKWEAQMTGECKPKPNPPATMRCHPADGEGIRTAEYLCYQGNWVIKDYVGECVKVDCTKLVINRPQFTNKRTCEEYAIRYAPCSRYGVSSGQYISSSHGSFVCLYSENCAGGLTLSELRTYGNYKCGPSQIVNLQGYH